ncbi:MAG: glycosyltransferase family 39 protein [Acidobacteria bacterium]|nr:glycosyltransferase family 39 protein [Acidobacteriota bacterium]
MNRLAAILKYRLPALAACLLFFGSGVVFLPHLGLQNDEAIFADALFEPKAVTYSIRLGHSRFPLMLMSYLGTVKSWIYRPLFRVFDTGVWTVRLPMLLAGVATIWLFYRFLERLAGRRAAIVGSALLATDSLYLLTICFDWGPVALQHLFTLGGILLLAGFYQTGSHRRLGWGWALLGLSAWDKALAVWLLGGMGVATVVILNRRFFAAFTLRRVAISVICFLVGALPLVIYNVNNHFATFRGNASWDTSDIPGKARLLAATADGHALFGWLVDEDWQTPNPHEPRSALTMASARISALAGYPRHNLMLYAFLLALLLAPLARGDAARAILWALLAMAIAWAQMAITANAGGSVHHAILLWPLPEMVVAISFAAASRRLKRAGVPVLAAVLTVLMAAGLLVTNEYYVRMRRNGGAINWTDAIFRLSTYMKTARASNVFSVDWGIMDNLRMLNHGTLPLRVGTDPISKPELNDADREFLAQMIGRPDHIFINHTKDFEFFSGVNDRLVKYARDAGYSRQVEAVIPDSNGRPVYEVYRFVR